MKGRSYAQVREFQRVSKTRYASNRWIRFFLVLQDVVPMRGKSGGEDV